MQRYRKSFYLCSWLLIVLVAASLTACGGDSQESVRKKVEKRMSQVDGYKASVEMTMKTGKEERQYDIQIWYKKDEADYYRVDLSNESDDHQQTILKNEEGVFVLTPILNKSFKFQADWPEKNGQPYLYQSLIQDLLTDPDAQFTASEDYYVYKTKTSYMNQKHLPFQQIYLDKKTYLPVFVQVLDEDEEALIEVKFVEMDMNPSFTEADFNRESILGGADGEETFATKGPNQVAEWLLPMETKGAELIDQEEMTFEDGTRVIMTFKGEKHFTLIQEQAASLPVMHSDVDPVAGELVHLGHSIGAISNGVVEWNYKGSQFILASEELTLDELMEVASSVQGRSIK